jgi:hypothetical protein
MATEFGGFAEPMIPGVPAPAPPTVAAAGKGGLGGGGDPEYGPRLINYLEKKNISWTVWCFDPEWVPTLISDWNYTLNSSGPVHQGGHGRADSNEVKTNQTSVPLLTQVRGTEDEEGNPICADGPPLRSPMYEFADRVAGCSSTGSNCSSTGCFGG